MDARRVNRHTFVLAVLAALAFAQTLAYYVYLRDDPGNYNGAGAQGDQVAYIDLAQQVLHGDWQGAVHYMPGLPVVIAVGQLIFGDPRLGIAVIHGVLFALLVLGVARLAGAVYGRSAELWSAALVALNPAIGYYAAQALTEFLTGIALFGLVALVVIWSRRGQILLVVGMGLLIGGAAYLRSEYLALTVLFGIVVWIVGRSARAAAVLVAAVVLAMAPWVIRYSVATGQPALYNQSPFSNLVLMGTWFRVFDEQTFSTLQQIETAAGSREDAIARASTVGPRPELSRRYIEQARGPYDRPIGETLTLAVENVRLNARQYLVNHVALAPVLIWAGHTPLRQSDAPRLPSSARYLIWGAELALLVLALWQAVRGLRIPREQALSVSFLGVVIFLTLVHVVIAVDDRFTTPALPLVGLLAGARLDSLVQARQRLVLASARLPLR